MQMVVVRPVGWGACLGRVWGLSAAGLGAGPAALPGLAPVVVGGELATPGHRLTEVDRYLVGP